MAKKICTLVGIVFLLVGIAGFVMPTLLNAHLSLAHNLVHIISGVIALYFGVAGTLAGARMFSLIFGIVYGLLGIAGFLLGKAGNLTIPGMEAMADSNLFQVIPGVLELGMMDHVIHILIGVLFLIGALATKAEPTT
jgi:hypothetical protein